MVIVIIKIDNIGIYFFIIIYFIIAYLLEWNYERKTIAVTPL